MMEDHNDEGDDREKSILRGTKLFARCTDIQNVIHKIRQKYSGGVA